MLTVCRQPRRGIRDCFHRRTTAWWLSDGCDLALVLLDQCSSWRHITRCPGLPNSVEASSQQTSRHIAWQDQPIRPIRFHPGCLFHGLSALRSSMGRYSVPLERRSYYCALCAVWGPWFGLHWGSSLAQGWSDSPVQDLFPTDGIFGLYSSARYRIVACGLLILPPGLVSSHPRQITAELRAFIDTFTA